MKKDNETDQKVVVHTSKQDDKEQTETTSAESSERIFTDPDSNSVEIEIDADIYAHLESKRKPGESIQMALERAIMHVDHGLH